MSPKRNFSARKKDSPRSAKAAETLKSREWKSHQHARVEIVGKGKVWKAKVLKMYF